MATKKKKHQKKRLKKLNVGPRMSEQPVLFLENHRLVKVKWNERQGQVHLSYFLNKNGVKLPPKNKKQKKNLLKSLILAPGCLNNRYFFSKIIDWPRSSGIKAKVKVI